jgi:hypothetical protein
MKFMGKVALRTAGQSTRKKNIDFTFMLTDENSETIKKQLQKQLNNRATYSRNQKHFYASKFCS